MEGERFLQSGRRDLERVKLEESGHGPNTFWKPLHGPHLVHEEVIVIADSDDDPME